MLVQFILCFVLVCGALYVPGYFVLKTAHLTSWKSVAFAPFVSIVLYCVLGVVYAKLGIFATGLNVLIPVLICSLIAFGASTMICNIRNVRKTDRARGTSSRSPLIPAAYVLVGIGLYSVIYLTALPTLDNVAETYDNVFHFNLIRSFVESGSWSTLDANANPYLDTTEASPAPFTNGGGYYPAAWHLICALPVSLLDVPVGIASNATNFAFVACVYPLSMCYFMQRIFTKDRLAVILGIFVTYAFGAYPWVLLVHWPLYPNLVSMTMAPLLCAAFIEATRRGASHNQRIAAACLFILGVLAEAFCQPNAVFFAMVFLAPYVVCEGSRAIQERHVRTVGKSASSSKHLPASRWLSGAAITILIIGFWYVLFKMPFLQPTVNYYWAPIMTVTQAVASSMSLSLALPYPQYALGVLVIIGAFFIVVKKREYLWVLAAYVFAIGIFIVAASLDNCWLKHFLSGFWYTDPYRVAAMVGMAGVPIAILGLLALCSIVNALILKTRRQATRTGSDGKDKIANAVIVVLVCCAVYIPGVVGSYGSGMFFHLHDLAGSHNAGTESVPYDDDEKQFVNRVNEIVNDDDVVLNNPYDGSMMAYGLSDLPTYYRSITGYGSKHETADSALLREKLSSLASDKEVREAIESVSADYVLVLENDPERMAYFYHNYKHGAWDGFESISDQTPGLELVLSDGEMKLYKIVSLD